VDQDEVVDKANLEDDLGADSLELVEMTMEAEEIFGIELPEEEANEQVIKTVADAVNLIHKHVKDKD
jgi:acyl carrier protein